MDTAVKDSTDRALNRIEWFTIIGWLIGMGSALLLYFLVCGESWPLVLCVVPQAVFMVAAGEWSSRRYQRELDRIVGRQPKGSKP